MSLRFAVLYGSVRSSRQGIKAARFLVRQLESRGHSVDLVDAKERPLPLLDRMYKEFPAGTAPEPMEWIHGILDAADAFVMVSGEYNHSIPPAFKNLLDHFQREYFFKPAGIATYSAGSFGGAHVAVHLRAILGELGMVSPSVIYHIGQVQKAFSDDGTPTDPGQERRAGRFLDEITWYAEALKARRASGTPF